MIGSKRPTKHEAARMEAIREIGCVIARHVQGVYVPCEVHHLTVGGKHGAPRRGHRYTVGLNPWSHRGYTLAGMFQHELEMLYGPSYVLEPRNFRTQYPDEWLLRQQDELLREYGFNVEEGDDG
jgi:hypothetical protein